MQNDGCKVRTNKTPEQPMSVRAVFTVVHCGAEDGQEGRTYVGHVPA